MNNNARIMARIGGVKVPVLIDSGSPINTLNEIDFLRLLKNKAELFQMNYNVKEKFTGYGSSNPLECMAKFVALIEVAQNKPRCYEEFFVINNARQSLLGKSSAERLCILKVGLEVNAIQIVNEFPKIPNIKVKLIIDKSVEPKQRTYNCIPVAQERRVSEMLDKMEEEGIIEEVKGYAEWISPLIVVPKGINDIRVCVDMRAPNQAIKRVVFPLPTLEFILVKLRGCKLFSKVDIRSAYHHVELDESSRYVTAFLTQKGVMQFRRLTFGINSAPEIFQRIMEQLMAKIDGAFCYLDDVIIAGKDEIEHDRRLENVLKVFKENNLTLNKDKCKFRLEQIDFLGLTISENKVRPSKAKIQAVEKFENPKTVEEVRSFLGLISYLGKFIPNAATKCEPLAVIVRDKVMRWDKPQQLAFDGLKKDLCTTVVELGIFDLKNETIVYTDASPTALGSALVQKNGDLRWIVEFAAKTLTDVERRYPQAQREALAAVWAVERFHYYLSGIKFTLCSDYRALQFIFKNAFRINKRAVSRAEAWALRLQHYNFEIKYIPGKDNIADPLSRLYNAEDEAFEEQSELFICNVGNWLEAISLEQVAEKTRNDEELKEVLIAFETDDWSKVKPKYRAMKVELSIIEGVIYKDFQVVIPMALIEKVLEFAHRGHPGEVTMKRLLRERVWWPNMTNDIHKKIKRCLGCALVSRANPPAPLCRTRIPEEAWVEIAIDFFSAGPLGELLVIVDYYSRYAIAKQISSMDAERTIKCLEEVFRIFGNPASLKSDNGQPFASAKFIEFCKSRAIELVKIPPYASQCNGLVERFNKNLKRILQIATVMKENLSHSLEEYVEIYNKRPCSVTNLSPFEMMMKRKPRTILPLGVLNNYWTEAEARERDAVEKWKGKIYADEKRQARVPEIQIGDYVMVKDMLAGNKLKCRYLNKKYQVIDRKFSVLILKDEEGIKCKRHVDHARKWPEEDISIRKEDTNKNEMTEAESPRKKRCIKKPARYLQDDQN